MKTKRVIKLPTCDLCKNKPAGYDAPTKMGPWANMCEDCYEANSGSSIGTKFIEGIAEAKVNEIRRIAKRTGEETCECPHCGEERLVESDANYKFNCEGCGRPLYVKDCLSDTSWMEK